MFASLFSLIESNGLPGLVQVFERKTLVECIEKANDLIMRIEFRNMLVFF